MLWSKKREVDCSFVLRKDLCPSHHVENQGPELRRNRCFLLCVARMAQPGAYRAHCQLRICSFRSVRGSSCGLISKSAGALIAKPVDWLF